MMRFIQSTIRAVLVTLFILCGGIFWILYRSQKMLEQPENPNDADD